MIWLFDIDGTLIRSGGAGSAAMAQALAHTFGVTPNLSSITFAGRTDREIIENLFQAHGIATHATNLVRFRAAYLETLPDALHANDGDVLSGVIPWLDCLHAHTATTIGLVTGNMQASARLKLEHFGLWQRFAFGGFGDQHRNRDHVAAMAIEAGELHRGSSIDRSQVWIVGDTPNDIRCARSQGANVIAVATGQYEPRDLEACQPDYLLGDLNDVALLHQILAQYDDHAG